MIKTVPVILYLMVGIVSLVMAKKSLLSERFIPFHENAAGMPLEQLDQRLQNVILALMKTTGLGFLVVGIQLVVFPILNYFMPGPVSELGIPLACEIFCFGLFLVNYRLHKKSGVTTPWKNSLIAMVIIGVGIILSIW